MMKKIYSMLFACLCMLVVSAQTTGTLFLNTLADYQLTGISPNGKWGCGVFCNGENKYYAFRWNLETNEIVLLSSDTDESEAYSVSDNGVVAGVFADKEATSNGAPVNTAGYWKDGSWHHLEIPEGGLATTINHGGQGYAVSRDGEYIGGALYVNGVYTPIVWHNGKIHRILGGGVKGMVYAVSPDGENAAGFTEPAEAGGARVATLWKGSEMKYLIDMELANSSFSGKRFSPDGKYLLYFGGAYDQTVTEADGVLWEMWERQGGHYTVHRESEEDIEGDTIRSLELLRAIYNMETGEVTSIPTRTYNPWYIDIFDINDKGTVVGYDRDFEMQDFAYISKDGITRTLENYLTEVLGVDLSSQKQVYARSGEEDKYMFANCVGLSNDEKTFGVVYYDTLGYQRSMIIKLDENLQTREPVGLKAEQLVGLSAARLNWKAPLAGVEGVKGYNIYRDGQKLNDAPVSDLQYVDGNLSDATYTYYVTAVYDGSVESEASVSVAQQIVARPVSAPYNLFARQKGLNNAYVLWTAPQSNLVVKSYCDKEATLAGFGGGNNSFEAAISYDAAEIALYHDHKITSVTFVPMSQQLEWVINIYKKNESGRTLVYTEKVSQELVYGVENVVKLTEPVELPTDGSDLFVAIAVTVPSDTDSNNVLGVTFESVTPAYSDWVRLFTEDEFYSLYEASYAQSYSMALSWAIGMILTPEGATSDIDDIAHYNVYDGEEKLGETTATNYELLGLSDGAHTLAVEAVYADGRVSDRVVADLDIARNEDIYKQLPAPSVTYVTPDNLTVRFDWDEPTDNDETEITYSSATLGGGQVGESATGYGYMAAATYDATKLKGYAGYEITAFKFFPMADADFTFILKENDVEICNLYAEDYTLNKWNTVMLDAPITVKEGATYMLMVDCFDVTPEEPAMGYDNQVPFSGKSDLVSTDGGENFTTLSDNSISANWMMGMVITDPEPNPLPVVGYNVRVDRNRVNNTILTETTYTYTFEDEDASDHRVNIDVSYEEVGTKLGGAAFFYIGVTELSENLLPTLRVGSVGTDMLVIEGEDIQTVALYDASGACVASVSGSNTVDISSLAPGVYVVKAAARPDRVLTGKVRILKQN